MKIFLLLLLLDTSKFVCGDTVLVDHKQYIVDNVKKRRVTSGKNILWKSYFIYKCYQIGPKNNWNWFQELKLKQNGKRRDSN